MDQEIDVISTEVVTPSSPTPPHLNKYKLSFLDQMITSRLMSAVLFYPPNHDSKRGDSARSNRLKKSLSQALTLFYPLAGRLVGNSYVDCNDEGVTYVEARAYKRKLFDVIIDPNLEEFNKFIPCAPEDGGDRCLVVQATFFGCGGLAIGFGISNKLLDAFSIAMFVNSWAAFSRGDNHIVQSPILESAILFPPKDLISHEIDAIVRKEKIATRLLVFSSEKIDELRDKYTKNAIDIEGVIRPTRIETLSAFIATRIMVSTRGAKDDHMTQNVFSMRMAVDIRKRVIPPLSHKHCGNMVVRPEITIPPLEKDDEEDGVYDIMKKMRDAIHNVNGENLFSINNRWGEAKKSEAIVCKFSSLCGFPLHKSDCGWGLPVWIGVCPLKLNNMVFFTNSFLSQGGIDAIVNMNVNEMSKFEVDGELLKYVSSGNDTRFVSRM